MVLCQSHSMEINSGESYCSTARDIMFVSNPCFNTDMMDGSLVIYNTTRTYPSILPKEFRNYRNGHVIYGTTEQNAGPVHFAVLRRVGPVSSTLSTVHAFNYDLDGIPLSAYKWVPGLHFDSFFYRRGVLDARKNVVLKLEDICNESFELLLALISTCFNVRKNYRSNMQDNVELQTNYYQKVDVS